MAGLPMSWWYCRMTSSGVGPRNMYNSTMPPMALQQGYKGGMQAYRVMSVLFVSRAWHVC